MPQSVRVCVCVGKQVRLAHLSLVNGSISPTASNSNQQSSQKHTFSAVVTSTATRSLLPVLNPQQWADRDRILRALCPAKHVVDVAQVVHATLAQHATPTDIQLNSGKPRTHTHTQHAAPSLLELHGSHVDVGI